MKTIVAIGGGELHDLQTLQIDHEIVRLTGSQRPRALLLPTASGDSELYREQFQAVYGDRLACRVDVLHTIRENPSADGIAGSVLGSDLIYVGGGNTLRMMRAWRRLGIDEVLFQAYEAGIVLSGLSAGSICWFTWGQSDSRKFTVGNDRWGHMRVRGLGIIPATHCPHYHTDESRSHDFRRMIGKHGGVGIALDDCCALILEDDSYRILSAQPSAGAYRVQRRSGQVVSEVITGSGDIGQLCSLNA